MRIRGWWLAVALVAVVILGWFATVITVEWVNRRAYVRDGEALAAAGFITEWKTVAEGLPDVDAAAQADWVTWCESVPMISAQGSLGHWVIQPDRTIPPDLVVEIDTHAAAMEPGVRLLQRQIAWGFNGSLKQRLASQMPPADWDSIPNLLAARSLATWLRWNALLHEDNNHDLDSLDRFTEMTSRPLLLIELMINVAIWDLRDQTMLDVIRLGKCADERAQRWIAEPSTTIEQLARAWMGERLFSQSWAQAALDGHDPGAIRPTVGIAPPTWQDNLAERLAVVNPMAHWQWASLPAGYDFVRHFYAEKEAQMRGDLPPPPLTAIGGKGNIIAAISIPNLQETEYILSGSASLARARRLAARIILDVHSGQPLPLDEADLTLRFGSVLLPTPDSCGLSYRKLPGGGFVVATVLSKAPTLLGPPRSSQKVTITAEDSTQP